MTKRMAIGLAGTLVACMLSGVVALTLGRGLIGAPAAGAIAPPHPIVKTETRVVTVHKRRPPRPDGRPRTVTVTVVRPSTASNTSSRSGWFEDDGHESKDGGGQFDD